MQLTQDRLDISMNPRQADPHVKLLITDIVYFMFSLLAYSDRRHLINDLSEMHAVSGA